MPQVKYRKYEHALSDRNRYGYFENLWHKHPKTKDQLVAYTEIGPKVWPVTVNVRVPIHNHEDLEFFIDAILSAFDALRGEYGENEPISPSAFRPGILK